MKNIYTSYQDLRQYSGNDIKLMARHQNILYTSNVNDLRWLLAINNTFQRAQMPKKKEYFWSHLMEMKIG